MHSVTAPSSGSGKTHLLNCASAVATGDKCAVIAMAGKDETEKRLITAAMSQQPIIAIDNVSDLLMGDFLCQATEQEWLRLRPLGTNNDVRCANSFTVFANRNNLTIGADNVRRSIQASLDAKMENPETREFKGDPVATILADRGSYIAAVLTIVRYYQVEGMPGRLPPTPSYRMWSDYVRSPLVWLGMADPIETIAKLRNIDPIRQERAGLFQAWAKELPEEWYYSAELAELAERKAMDQHEYPQLFRALLGVAGTSAQSQKINTRSLGKWLSKNANNIAAGYCLCVENSDQARPKYKVIKAK
jgi:putative DNA primase/helicase